MLTILKEDRGSATVAGILFSLILVVLAASLVDVYRIQDTRTFAYSAANDAALRGASFGRDWNQFMGTGQMSLDAALAKDSAQGALAGLMQTRGIALYHCQVEVLPNSGGGSVSNFPPVARASLWNSATWIETRPAVGVYVEVPVQTILFGLINGNQPITVHAFAAAGVIEQ